MAKSQGPSDDLAIPSKSAAISENGNFEALLQKYTESCMRTNVSHSMAMDIILQGESSIGQAEAFFRWAAQHFKNTTYFDIDQSKQMSNIDFKTHLANANWRRGGSALCLVNSRLCQSNGMDYIPLGRFKNYWLALRADNVVMIPKESGFAIQDSYEVTVVNSNNILGARYDSVAGKEKHTLLFAQLGSVLSTTNKEGLSHTSLTERHCDWDETGFVLALEILESGSVGKFYIICNLTRQNEWEELTDEDVFGDYWLRRLCGEEPQFTIAQVEGQGPDLIKDSWAKASEEQDEIRLSVLSTLRPEIVETGLAKDGHDRRLVALYPS